MADDDASTPPVGEELHLPGPSIIPLLNAVGLVLCFLSLTTIPYLAIFGAPLFLVTLVRWIGDTRREVDALPSEHH